MCDSSHDDADVPDVWEAVEPEEVLERLTTSIQEDNLSIFCGAGLSMGGPSALPSAHQLTDKLKERYLVQNGVRLVDRVRETLTNPPEEGDLQLDHIALWALETGQFRSFFLSTIITAEFFARPNRGHLAVADFLLAEAARATISTNVDYLIERAAEGLGRSDFDAVVREPDVNLQRSYNELLKLHGCLKIERENTVWCERQLDRTPIRERVTCFQRWMQGRLLGSDLLIVGYWSDWPHITETFVDSVRDFDPPSVYLVDLANPEELRNKAPTLAQWVEEEGVNFFYIPCSGEDFLDRLREKFSKSFCRQLAANTYDLVEDFYGEIEEDTPFMNAFEGLTTEELYGLRRDYAGVPDTEPAPHSRPEDGSYDRIGALHHILCEWGASLEGRFYDIGGDLFRLVNSVNRSVPRVQGIYADEKPLRGPRAYVCVGGNWVAGRSNVVRDQSEDDVIRTQGSVEWWSEEEFLDYLDQDA